MTVQATTAVPAARGRPNQRRELIITAVVIVGALLLPVLLQNPYHATVAKNLVVTIIVTLGFSLLFGFTGQLSLAHAAFYAIGAYGPPILMNKAGFPLPLAVLCAWLIAAVAAVIVGIPTLRLAGYYLAVGTLALAILSETVLNQWTDLTGGAMGITDVQPIMIGDFAVRGQAFFWLALAVAIAVYLFLRNVLHSRVGRAFLAIRESESAAAAVGINVAFYKVLAFVISSVIAAIGGTLYAFNLLYVNPFLVSLDNAFIWLFMVLVGGLGSLAGTMLGTAVLYLIPEVFSFLSEYYVLVSGVVMIFVMLFAPGGMIRLFDRFQGQDLTRASRPSEPETALAPVDPEVVGPAN
jgi:branched-chain amino acid transport system permease protein